MLKVTSQEFQRNSGLYQDRALKELIIITHYGRDRLVLMDVSEYQKLRKRARVVLDVASLSSDDLGKIKSTVMSTEHNHLNDEMNNSK